MGSIPPSELEVGLGGSDHPVVSGDQSNVEARVPSAGL